MDRTLIDAYEAGAEVPASAVRDLTPADLDALPVPGTWSLRQVIAHLMDSDLIGSERMKRVIAMDAPALIGYDESAFARALDYEGTDVGLASQVFAINRKLTARILRGLLDAAFARPGDHSEHGPMSLADLVASYVGHLDHHLTFICRKREVLGKPLA